MIYERIIFLSWFVIRIQKQRHTNITYIQYICNLTLSKVSNYVDRSLRKIAFRYTYYNHRFIIYFNSIIKSIYLLTIHKVVGNPHNYLEKSGSDMGNLCSNCTTGKHAFSASQHLSHRQQKITSCFLC